MPYKSSVNCSARFIPVQSLAIRYLDQIRTTVGSNIESQAGLGRGDTMVDWQVPKGTFEQTIWPSLRRGGNRG